VNLSADDRQAAGKLFGEIADQVLSWFPDAEVTGFIGDGNRPAQLQIRIGVPEEQRVQNVIDVAEDNLVRRHSHPCIGRKRDVTVHTHGPVQEGHEHRLAHLGPMQRASDPRVPEDVALAEPTDGGG
jgi:hypothetical protein